jgi:hypothetical protein
MVQNWGIPNAIELNWWGCRVTFLEWDHLFWAIRQRVELKGLQLVAVASSVKKNLYGQPSLLALVARDSNTRRRSLPAVDSSRAFLGIVLPSLAGPALLGDKSLAVLA